MMKRIAISLLTLLVSSAAWTNAYAECQDESEVESGWYFRSGTNVVEPDGTLIIAGQFSGTLADAPNDASDFVMRRATDDTEVAGTFEYVVLANETRVQWTPAESLETGERLYGNAFGMDWEQFTVEVVESVPDPAVSVDRLVRREFEFIEEQKCCDVDWGECQNPCSDECVRCGIESFTYAVFPEFDVAIETTGYNDQWTIEILLLQSDGETPFDSEGAHTFFASTPSHPMTGRALPEGTTDYCVRWEVRNLLTQEVTGSDVSCVTDAPLNEASRSDTRTLDTDLCIGETVDVYGPGGAFEQVPIEEIDDFDADGNGSFGDTTGDNPTKTESDGCAVGSGSPGVLLLLIALFGIRRRRRE